METGGLPGAWEHFHHQADIGIRGIGPTREEAFAQGGVALTAVITAPENVHPKKGVELSLSAPEDAFLFLDFINELIFLVATEGMLFSRFELRLEQGRLQGHAWGEPIDLQQHEPAVEVKAATLNALEVFQREDKMWVAQCVVDV
ncbi:MAG: archease [Desulfovibrionales bacterium]